MVKRKTIHMECTCEFSDMKLLRQYFKNIGVEKENIYISSYWKKNSDQEEHKLFKNKTTLIG